MMKILFVMLEGHGGMYQHAVLLCNKLSENHKVTAVIPSNSESEFFSLSVNVIEMPVGDTIRNTAINMFKIKPFIDFFRTLSKTDADVIHFYNVYNPWPVFLLPLLRRFGIVISIPEGRLHAGMTNRYEMMLSREIHIIFADVIITLSIFDKFMLSMLARKKTFFVIPHPVNTFFSRYAKQVDSIPNSILFFGAPMQYKGLEFLIKAYPLVKQAIPAAKLILAGRGNFDWVTKQLSPEFLDSVILDNRFIPPDMVAEYFQKSTIVVLPYIEVDHTGNIPIAYAFDKPVVATTPISETVEHERTGLVVPPRDEKALAQAIIRLLRDEELRFYIQKNIPQYVKGHMSLDIIAERHVQAYKAALVESSKRSN